MRVRMLSWPFRLRRLCGKWYCLLGYLTTFVGIVALSASGVDVPVEASLGGLALLLSAPIIIASISGAREILPDLQTSLSAMRKGRVPFLAELHGHRAFLLLLLATPIITLSGLILLERATADLDYGLGLTSALLYTLLFGFALAMALYGAFRLDVRSHWRKSLRDAAPFALYLRTFSTDSELITSPIAGVAVFAALQKAFGPLFSVERVIYRACATQGLAGVAVGAPGELMPPLGFERLYFSDEVWQHEVSQLINKSTTVIVNCSTSKWVRWELEELRRQDCNDKLILMSHATTVAERIRHLNFGLTHLGLSITLDEILDANTIALARLQNSAPVRIDGLSDDLFAYLDVTTVGLFARSDVSLG